MPSRRVEDLTPEMQDLFREFAARMAEAQLPFVLTSTRRTLAEQEALYAQGRTAPGPVVTWTMKSKHLEGKAFDIALVRDGKAHWNTKIDVNENEVPDYREAGSIGESVGLVWGGRWKTPDLPHFQMRDE